MRTAIILALFPIVAKAHGLVIHSPIIGDATIRITVSFDDDEPLIKGTVKLLDADGKEVATGTTDDKGVVDLPRPKFGTYTLRADDGGTHAQTMKLLVSGELVNVETRPDDNKWLTMAIGLGVIAVLGLLLRFVLKPRGPASSSGGAA